MIGSLNTSINLSHKQMHTICNYTFIQQPFEQIMESSEDSLEQFRISKIAGIR